MDTNSIRRTFLDFFVAREHEIVPSASLIPVDPTLLLTNAGMVPFKPFMLGEEAPPYRRAVSIQKCARTVDIDIVGTTARHLTFFEMLGNFSFGDYFKEKAIPWAYDLVTEGFGLDPDRLWYTVHKDDDEAHDIWIDGVGVAPERVQRRDRDNFWQMGVAGPAGPSSEVFYDKGSQYGPDGGPVVDEERFMEIWNLVFMQYLQDEPYHVVGDLPAKNIDTGAGLERIATVLQGVDTLFEVDSVRPVVATAERLSGASYGTTERTDISLRIMADHARAVTTLIADKVVPSNEGRGYVLRRLLRRAVRHAHLLGCSDLVMPDLIATTVDVMGEAYPALVEQQDAITTMAVREETRFRRTLESGHQLLDEELTRLEDGDVFPGATVFKLHDTYGFPRELTEEILTEKGIRLDLEEFQEMMTQQRERARRSFKGGDAAERADAYRGLLGSVDATEFIGHSAEAATGRILSILREGEVVERAEEGQQVEVFLDVTSFYAESGGQVGDTGMITSPTGSLRVGDTQYSLPGLHGHRGVVSGGHLQAGQEVTAEVDAERREHIRKNHTGTHLLHWALRNVVGDHAHQAGSLVEPERLRFDFSHFDALAGEEVRAVEQLVNERVYENAEVTTLETSKTEAEKMGALAFFGDKYGERVRVVRAGDYSVEFCGGTHVRSTGQVGPLILVSEGSVAANTRRVEALTGPAAYELIVDMRRRIEDAESALRAQPGQLVEAAISVAGRVQDQEQRIEEFEARARSGLAATILETAETLGPHSVVAATVDDVAPGDLRSLAFQVRDRLGSGIGVLGSTHKGKGALVVWVTPELVESGVSAGEVIGGGARVLGGGGSKDPSLAQAGGPKGDQVGAAVAESASAAREALAAP